MPGPLRHIGELARARATKRSSERDDDQALAELEARPSACRTGSRSNGSGVSGYRLSYEGQDDLRRPLPLAGPAAQPAAAAHRRCPTRRRSTASSGRPGEVVGVLVGHTHFDHAVDAPAIARRFGCKAYGSDSLVTLMGLHGLAEQTVEVEPYRTYELGPFEVSFTPSVHSKLLLGLAVPYDGDLTCEHLDGLSPNAYRCGQVWGISIGVAGLRPLPPGQRQPDRRRGPRARASTSSSPGSPGATSPTTTGSGSCPCSTRASSSPPTTTTSSARSGRQMEFVANVQLARAARGDRRGQPRHRGRGAARADLRG